MVHVRRLQMNRLWLQENRSCNLQTPEVKKAMKNWLQIGLFGFVATLTFGCASAPPIYHPNNVKVKNPAPGVKETDTSGTIYDANSKPTGAYFERETITKYPQMSLEEARRKGLIR